MHWKTFPCLIIDSVSFSRKRNCEIDFEPCSKLEDLNLDVKRGGEDREDRGYHTEASSTRYLFFLQWHGYYTENFPYCYDIYQQPHL